MKTTVVLTVLVGIAAGSSLAWGQDGASVPHMQHMQQMGSGAAPEMPRGAGGAQDAREFVRFRRTPWRSTCSATCAITSSL